ncbi:staphylococcal nuclease domain-containing protein 1 [Harmonia axyridis]|uniref:staphylococcal nuclease domain-containing protein 1 n=1 Tax=Harmonia axyridis TaxID=115357 RepID=UPI001E278853|nr:staphylococcal nuclease domain-containing protein 1 [Harmonia axyridis]
MMTTQQIQPNRGIVKQVLSGDSVIVRNLNNPAAEKQINFSGVIAPKLCRRLAAGSEQNETKDEPWAWEAREFLRKKLLDKEVFFTSQVPPNANREYGTLYFGNDFNSAENITDTLISEGLVTVKKEGVRQNEELQRLVDLENAAKQAGKGKWSKDNPADHVRDVKWGVENEQMATFVKKHAYKPIKAIIEHVRDGSTVRAFLLPDFYHVTVMITGIRCPGFKLDSNGKPDPNIKVPFADEARTYVERRLLQHDIEIILESVNNNNFIGTIIHPKGNIAESLLREGLAHCVDWSISFLRSGSEKLRAAEQVAKEKRVRIWKDWQAHQPKITGKERDYNAIVTEIVNGDAVMVKLPNGEQKKVFLSSLRPPREGSAKTEEEKNAPKSKSFRPLYDIPYMYEAREYLRKELIGKKVHVLVDYIQEARDSYPEKTCATVTIGGKNIAEGLVAKGLATVVKYRADDDQRSSRHHDLLDAEMKAIKSQVGLHSKKKAAPLRVAEIDATRAKLDLSSLQRAQKTEAIVEFVTSGSRVRLYIPKTNSLCTFLLGGINCPRAARPAIGTQPAIEGEPFGEEAFKFTKEHCLQRDVTIQVTGCSTTGKTASLIGWLWVDNLNLSVALVNLGYASVHRTGEKSQFATQLKEAEDNARKQRLGIWKDYVEEKEEIKVEDEKVTEAPDATYEEVVVTEITPEGHFFVQTIAEGPKAEALNAKFRQEFQANPPLPGSFTPKRGEICAAKFVDNEWYRAKVEKVQGSNAQIHYIDYGNRETLPLVKLAALPSTYANEKPFATEYCLPFVILPKDEEYAEMALKFLKEDTKAPKLYLSVVYRNQGAPNAASLHTEKNAQSDIIKNLVNDGLLMIENIKNRRNNKVLSAYKEAQETAKKNRAYIWEYGDITVEDTKEFGMGN